MRPPRNPPVTGKAAEELIKDIQNEPSDKEKEIIKRAKNTIFPL